MAIANLISLPNQPISNRKEHSSLEERAFRDRPSYVRSLPATQGSCGFNIHDVPIVAHLRIPNGGTGC